MALMLYSVFIPQWLHIEKWNRSIYNDVSGYSASLINKLVKGQGINKHSQGSGVEEACSVCTSLSECFSTFEAELITIESRELVTEGPFPLPEVGPMKETASRPQSSMSTYWCPPTFMLLCLESKGPHLSHLDDLLCQCISPFQFLKAFPLDSECLLSLQLLHSRLFQTKYHNKKKETKRPLRKTRPTRIHRHIDTAINVDWIMWFLYN